METVQKQICKNETLTRLRQVQVFIQAQLQKITLKESVLLISLVGTATAMRTAMQGIPSVEPITFFAVLAGILLGKKSGFGVGFSSLMASNFFVFGGHGPWTIFQAFGFGIAGYLGGYLNKRSGVVKCAIIVTLATIMYEIIVNVGSTMIFGLAALPILFLTALPFSIIHVTSNFVFSLAIPKTAKKIEEVGELGKKRIYGIFGNFIANRIRDLPELSENDNV